MPALQQAPHDKTPHTVFVSYSHKDIKLVDELLDGLNTRCRIAYGHDIKFWRDTTDMSPGDLWHTKITNALEACDLGLLLTSPNFFASDYIREYELTQFVNPTGHHKAAIPVLLRPMNLKLLDTGGLSAQQFYHYQNKSFYELRGRREHFINGLFEAMLQIITRNNREQG